MDKVKETLYINCEYLLLSDDNYFSSKYQGLVNFIAEDTVEGLIGKDWLKDQQPFVNEFKKRMNNKRQKIDSIAEPIIFGKIKEAGSPFLISELVLLSEIALNKSIDEMDKLIKTNKVIIKTI